MPDDARARYLAQLDEQLPMPAEERAEILEEIDTHLDDAVEDALARGVPIDRAESGSQARLGAPIDLARELSRPHQPAWSWLAAAGAGIRSGIGHWLYGYLVGALATFLLAIVLTALVQLSGRLLGNGWRLEFSDQGWNAALVAAAIATGLYYAGRAIPRAVSRSSRRLVRDVRPWAVSILTVLAAALLLLVVESPHNAASVVAFMLAPGATVLGAYHPTLLPDRVRLSHAAIAALAMLVLAISLGAAATLEVGDEPAPTIGAPDRGLSRIGPNWPGHAVLSGGWGQQGGVVRWAAEVVRPGALVDLRDLRLEAWHADPATFDIDARHDAPFATAPVIVDGSELRAEIVTTGEPGVSFWDLVLTGVGPDGRRYVVDAGNGGSSTFTGTAWDWIVAVTD